MDDLKLSILTRQVIAQLASSDIGSYIDTALDPPAPFRGTGKIKLIVLGQDPTVQDPKYRESIRVTLLLNQPGRLRTYLDKVCRGLGISLDENVYATNLLKNFFTVPPDSLRKNDPQFFPKAAAHWIPLLLEEIHEYPNVPVLPLGEPILNCLVESPRWMLIRDYWGYEGPGIYGLNFRRIEPPENILGRVIYPFPHIPGLSHRIYRSRMEAYVAFIKKAVSSNFF